MPTRTTLFATASVAAVGVALLLNRQLGRRWGATTREVDASLPGDDLIPQPVWETTHGITIRAPARDVWPWLVQMGITRGGWYLSERLDRIVWRIDNPSVDRIVPELQQLSAGDVVPDSINGTAHFRVALIEPNRSLVLHSRRHPTTGIWPDLSAADPGLYLDFSWAFVLDEVDDDTTRLLLRTRAIVMQGRKPAPGWMRLALPIADFGDFIYTRQMLRGIRRRVEAHERSRNEQPVELPIPIHTKAG
ncbi:MAG: hypothetical protein R3A46_12305 [Thermomicrobiales bacterium]